MGKPQKTGTFDITSGFSYLDHTEFTNSEKGEKTVMKVGSRGDYGLRALTLLASEHDLNKPMQIHAIASRQQIPEDYLRQLLLQLRTAGLVKSVRGPHGGYLLAKAPTDISMSEVLRVLEGAPDEMTCRYAKGEVSEPCALYAGCAMRQRWDNATTALAAVLEETMISDLVASGNASAEKREAAGEANE